MKGTFWRFKGGSEIFKATSVDSDGFVTLRNMQDPKDKACYEESYVRSQMEEMINYAGNRLMLHNVGAGWTPKVNHDALRARGR